MFIKISDTYTVNTDNIVCVATHDGKVYVETTAGGFYDVHKDYESEFFRKLSMLNVKQLP